MKANLPVGDLKVIVKQASLACERGMVQLLNQLLLRSFQTGVLAVTGTRLITTITSSAAADDCEDGRLLVPAELFNNVIQGLPADQTVYLSLQGNKLVLRCAGLTYKFQKGEAEDFPKLFGLPSKRTAFDLARFSRLVDGAAYAVAPMTHATERARSLYLRFNSSGGMSWGVDGTRGAKATDAKLVSKTELEFLIPRSGVEVMQKICAQADDEEVNIGVLDNRLTLHFASGVYYSVALSAVSEAVNPAELIPKTKLASKVDLVKCQESIRRIRTFTDRSSAKFVFSKDKLVISVFTEQGEASEVVPASGDAFERALSPGQVKDALDHMEGSTVEFGVTEDDRTPAVMRSSDGRSVAITVPFASL